MSRKYNGHLVYNLNSSSTPSPVIDQKQSDWNVTDTSSVSYIKNKPTQLTDFGGTLPISQGGTGGTTKTEARTNLEVYTPVSLYSNSSGTSSTITLSDSYTNYEKIEIMFEDNGAFNSVSFYPSIANYVVLTNTYSNDYTASSNMFIFIHTCLLTFTNRTAVFSRQAVYTIQKDNFLYQSNTDLKVKKIIGYKH